MNQRQPCHRRRRILHDCYDLNTEGRFTTTVIGREILRAGAHVHSATQFRHAALGPAEESASTLDCHYLDTTCDVSPLVVTCRGHLYTNRVASLHCYL